MIYHQNQTRKLVWNALRSIHSSEGMIRVNYGVQHQDPINPLERLILEEFLSKDYKCIYFQIR